MTVSMRRMSAGSGYRYLLKSVAAGDSGRDLSTPLTRYYADVGTPPGRWMGSGLGAFGEGQIVEGSVVTEEQLALLVGMGRDPATGEQLGRAYPIYEHAVDGDEHGSGATRRAVAGFDLTFSVPKSVSVLWGVADADVQARIVAAHHAAVADVIAYFEREVAATRAGFTDQDGAVAQVAVAGVAAAAFDHVDSRSNDPQLHTHVVIASKVRTEMDGRWRSLDGRPVFAARTGLSAHYDALLVDRLSRELGLEWELRQRASDRNPRWELAGVPDALIREFSGRTKQIEAKKDELIAEYAVRHGRHPSARAVVEIRARATLATRPPKMVRSLADLTAEWRARTAERLGRDPAPWAAALVGRGGEPISADAVSRDVIEAISDRVVAEVSARRATWSHWNLMAEASTQTTGLLFATTDDRVAVLEAIVEAAQRKSLILTPAELASAPFSFKRPDGTSVFRPLHGEKYSSRAVLDAEARLLARASDASGPRVSAELVERELTSRPDLSGEQRDAVRAITRSARQVDLLVGPAGAGKTTTMCALRAAWVAGRGRGSVVGLAPSAAAAQALSAELGVPCENTAKWLYEHSRGRTCLRRGQLVILDEATLAGTTMLDRITAIAANAGAKVLLVGDPHQLHSVEAGGAFAFLVGRRADTPQLLELHRFHHEWERAASLGLRSGDQRVIDTYQRHGRLRGGRSEAMLDEAYAGWRADRDAGLSSLLIADSSAVVRALNERARAERILTDHTGEARRSAGRREVELRDGTRASVGDLVITRRNDRTLAAQGGEWVRNGGRWQVTRVRRDGALVVTRLGPEAGSAVLPRSYVLEHVDLGYAVTAHRAQGLTVDTAHTIVTTTSIRETFYVAMTRGRQANRAYVTVDEPDDAHPELDVVHQPDVDARAVLAGVLAASGAAPSAHETIREEHRAYGGIARLAAELETIAAGAQRERFLDLMSRSGLTDGQLEAVRRSRAFGTLAAALRRAEANHHDLDILVPRVVQQHPLDDAQDVAALLEYRVAHAASAPPRGCPDRPRLIAGLIAQPLGPMTAEHRTALDERRELIELRAGALADEAIATDARWIQLLGRPPADHDHYDAWRSEVATVAAYRDRHGITSDRTFDVSATTDVQRIDRLRAAAAARRSVASASASSRSGAPVQDAVGTRPSV